MKVQKVSYQMSYHDNDIKKDSGANAVNFGDAISGIESAKSAKKIAQKTSSPVIKFVREFYNNLAMRLDDMRDNFGRECIRFPHKQRAK